MRTRRDRLRQVIGTFPGAAPRLGSHAGFCTAGLARRFRSVQGVELRDRSLRGSEMVLMALGRDTAANRRRDLLNLDAGQDHGIEAHFVLVYGLLYHVEDPFRLLPFAPRHILSETQVPPCGIAVRVEDGSRLWQRDIHGGFGLVTDDSERREGGGADFAFVPWVRVLRRVGCAGVRLLPAGAADHERFRRGDHVIIHGITG